MPASPRRRRSASDPSCADGPQLVDGGVQRHRSNHVRRARFLPLRRRRPQHLVQVDRLDRATAGQERIAFGECRSGADQDPGAEGRIHLVPAPRDEVRIRRDRSVGGELRGIDHDRHAPLVSQPDDGIQRRLPAGDVGGAGDGEEAGPGTLVERRGHVPQLEHPVAAALDVPAPGDPPPRKEVGVVLDDRRPDDVVGSEAEPVRQVIDGLGGVPADDGDVVTPLPAGERQSGVAGRLVGGRRGSGLRSRSPVDAAVAGQELHHPLDHGGEGGGGGSVVQVDHPTFLPVDAEHGDVVTDEASKGAAHPALAVPRFLDRSTPPMLTPELGLGGSRATPHSWDQRRAGSGRLHGYPFAGRTRRFVDSMSRPTAPPGRGSRAGRLREHPIG